MEDAICPTYNSILKEYTEKAYPFLEELKTHIRGCVLCQQYLLENRDAIALQMIGMPDEEFRDKMKQ